MTMVQDTPRVSAEIEPWEDQADPRRLLHQQDPELYQAIQNERQRQRDGIELIASENYTSAAVMAAMGSVLTNKYAEGYPGKRYYGGCQYVDVVENLAIERAKALFGAEHVNVQPHSGAQANEAVYLALLQPGDKVLALRLDQGGHLSHGSPLNSSGKLYQFIHYGVDRESGRIDYDEVQRLASEHHPKLLVCGASAYPRWFDYPRLRQIADSVEAKLMMDMAHVAGLVAANLHPDPVPYCEIVTTTTHKTLRSARGGMILCREEYAKAIDKAVFPGIQGGPLMNMIAGKAAGLGEALKPEFRVYQQQVLDNAHALADELLSLGHRLVSGGTDNHLVLLDVSPLGITGKQAEKALDSAGLHTNKNMIPYDPQPPLRTSGIRLGTPAATTRGMGPEEFRQVGRWIDTIVRHVDNADMAAEIHEQVIGLARRFSVPA